MHSTFRSTSFIRSHLPCVDRMFRTNGRAPDSQGKTRRSIHRVVQRVIVVVVMVTRERSLGFCFAPLSQKSLAHKKGDDEEDDCSPRFATWTMSDRRPFPRETGTGDGGAFSFSSTRDNDHHEGTTQRRHPAESRRSVVAKVSLVLTV